MTKIGALQDGLDVTNFDVTTPEEIAAFHAEYERTGKGRLASYEFWIEFGPDVLKRHKARSRHLFGDDGAKYPLSIQLMAIHQYTIERFRGGIGYEVRLARSNGAQKSDLIDTLSVAFLHSGHGGMYEVHAEATEVLRGYENPPLDEHRFPPNWSFDPGAFDSGMDYANREATPEDMERLMQWYQDTIGEVPRSARFLARHRPGLLKAHRNRYEHAIRESLPKQMLPYLLLSHAAVRQDADGIRENVLLGRALGMTRDQLLDAVGLSVLFAGMGHVSFVDEVAGDLIDAAD